MNATATAQETPRAPTKKTKAKPKRTPSRTPTTAPTVAAETVSSAPVAELRQRISAIESSLLRPLENASPFVKWGLYGEAGTGKTHTLVEILIGLVALTASTKPVVLVNPEASLHFLIPRFAAASVAVQQMTSRSLADLGRLLADLDGVADVVGIDNLTGYYDDLIESYRRHTGIDELGPSDWSTIKSVWRREFSTAFRQFRGHVVFTGRSADAYNPVVDEDGAITSMKTGTKLRAEKDTAYEPDLLIEMERVVVDGRQVRRARVVKDRANLVDGAFFDDPTFQPFAGVARAALAHAARAEPIEETSTATLFGSAVKTDRRQTKALLEQIHSELAHIGSLTTVQGKLRRGAALFGSFGTSAWSEIETIPVVELTRGLELLRQCVREGGPAMTPPTAAAAPDALVDAIRRGLTEDQIARDALERKEPPRASQNRALFVARTLLQHLGEPHRAAAEAEIKRAAHRWGQVDRISGGVAGSGGGVRQAGFDYFP